MASGMPTPILRNTFYEGVSPVSSYSGSSALSASPLRLDPSTLALLDSFMAEKSEEERRFNELAEQAAAKLAGMAMESDDEEFDYDSEGTEDGKEEGDQKREKSSRGRKMVSVDEYRVAFGEDWQLSQFWYSTDFATKLARALRGVCTPTSNIAFMCCPTAYVAFQHMNPLRGARLLEYDNRFSVLARRQYVHYDLDEPLDVPDEMVGTVDIVVLDPPFLNEMTNRRAVATLRKILHPTRGRVVLITSTSMLGVMNNLYVDGPGPEDDSVEEYKGPKLGPLRRCAIEVEHGRLANDFACWASWEGGEDFGKDDDAEV